MFLYAFCPLGRYVVPYKAKFCVEIVRKTPVKKPNIFKK